MTDEPTTGGVDRLRQVATEQRQTLLEADVCEYGFTFTDEHRRIEQLVRLLEARAEALALQAHESPRWPPLSVIRGGTE